MRRESPEALVLNPLARQAALTHRIGYLCLDKAFALIEGHPRISHFGLLAGLRSVSALLIALTSALLKSRR
jgi:hypothetical protein